MFRPGMLLLTVLADCVFGDNTTEVTANRTFITCHLGDDVPVTEYLPFTPYEEEQYHVPSIRMENCTEDVAYPECFPWMFQQIRMLHDLMHQTVEYKKHAFTAMGSTIHYNFVQVTRLLYENITVLGDPGVLDDDRHNVCFTFNISNWQENLGWHDSMYDSFSYYETFYIQLYQWHNVYFPVIFPILLIVGLVGNVIVLFIVAKNHLMWTTANKVVLNLAISDILFLIFNIGIFYLSFHDPNLMDNTLCYVKIFGENLATAASVYSTTLLSVLRYIAVAAITGGWPRRIMSHRRTIPTLLIFIWILAAIAAVLNVVHMNESQFECSKHKGGTIGGHRVQHMRELESNLTPHLTRLITICILPLLVILFFSIATTRMLRRSAKDIPGETLGLGNARQEREKGAYITLALVTVFVITHVPIHIANLIFLYRESLDIEYVDCLPLLYIPRILFPLNSCLNPIVLFVASRSFRVYLKNYVLCGYFSKMAYHSCRTRTQTSSLRY